MLSEFMPRMMSRLSPGHIVRLVKLGGVKLSPFKLLYNGSKLL